MHSLENIGHQVKIFQKDKEALHYVSFKLSLPDQNGDEGLKWIKLKRLSMQLILSRQLH